MNSYFLYPAVFVLVYMTFWYVISMWKKRMDVADVAWGLGFVGLAAIVMALAGEPTLRQAVVFFLVGIWGLRLFFYIAERALRKGEEDPRYKAFRRSWKKTTPWRSYLQVFLLQGVLMYLIALPVLLLGSNSVGFQWNIIDWIALALWVIGFLFETIGDAQLASFIKDPKNKGRIMTKGLWKWTRHPNYFGEVCMWWGIGLFALSVPWGHVGLIGPFVITNLILFISGIPMAEKRYENNEEYVAYKMKTSAFFPLPPKS